MRVRSIAALVFASLFVLLTGGPSSLAENEDLSRYPGLGQRLRQQRMLDEGGRRSYPYGYARPERRGGYGYGGSGAYAPYGYGYRAPPQPYGYGRNPYEESTRPRRYRERPAYADRPASPYGSRYRGPPEPAQEEGGGSLFPWFSRPAEVPHIRPRPEPTYVEPREIQRPRRTVRPAPAPQQPREVKRKPKVEPTTFVAVFGDSLAELVAQGLDQTNEDAPEIEVVHKTRAEAGLTRAEADNLAKMVEEFFASGRKVTHAVVMLGVSDRQPIRDGDTAVEPLSDRWRELYGARIDAVLAAFANRRVPVVWVGAPPVRNERLSTDLIALNDLYRERVQRAGATYVDIWEAFVNDENHYSPLGPGVEGQIARLRTNDGVHFTRAGARKAAHFAEIELKRLLEGRAPAAADAAPKPAPEMDPGAIERQIIASLPALPQPAGLPSFTPRPLAGPVLPLTRPEVSPGAALADAPPRLEGDAAAITERALREGLASPPRPGRADDFKWPRS